ncbi:MAG: putative flavoprotein involved in transport, partial [Actinomycetia bacterium]|nr:putative flavoprotein involved in transport [Actinomycetes bacterium]
GTWYENQYPGCRVDVGNHFYCYSFEPADHWTEFFAQQPELHRYFVDVMGRHGIEPHVRWRTEVVRAVWDEPSATWLVTVRTADGAEEVLTARAVISAVGQLNRPFVPEIPGLDDFEGPTFHSARWDHSIELKGARVAMIGAGASGFQIAPTIAEDVAHLTVFQRTAQWMFPNPNYHAKVGPGVTWAMRHLPFYGRWYRFLIFWPASGRSIEKSKIDPSWADQQRAVNDTNELTRQMFTDWITSQVQDPELLAKVIPDYPATGKRTLQDNGSWLQALQRDNVELVRDGIDHVERDAIVTVDGVRHEVDLIVCATGFQVNKFLWPMEIVGRDGVVLSEQWDGGEEASAYLGITVPNFPNFFCLYGPGTNLAHGGSLIFHSECEMRYISGCLDILVSGGRRSMDVRKDVHDAYDERHQAEINSTVWASPAIKHSFYKNRSGRIRSLSPWPLADFWSWTRTPDAEEYVID